MHLVKRIIEPIQITYDGYEFCYNLPEEYTKDQMKEWREKNKTTISQIKMELRQEHHKRDLEIIELAKNAE